ncbi:MAG TPA: hypothetical protein VL528_01240 [Oxalicibacterium sp.]|jgi:hypothetical protein|nr:hypothetical protein [Oxalicibacterium sp.]
MEQTVHPKEEGDRSRYAHIQGWGADLDHSNRPGYPMERMPARLPHPPQHEPEQQPVDVTVFHSIERPRITPVFGTSVPPSGCSGRLRAWAFKYSENNIFHWLLLLFADRINMMEGIGDDLRSGHVPNVLGEMGIKAELKHNPVGFARKVAVTSAVVGVACFLIARRKRRA